MSVLSVTLLLINYNTFSGSLSVGSEKVEDQGVAFSHPGRPLRLRKARLSARMSAKEARGHRRDLCTGLRYSGG